MTPQSPEERAALKTADTAARRFAVGCIATLVRDGDVLVRHFTGAKADATRAVAAFCDAGGWRVRSLSTPDTVAADLRGRRAETSAPSRFGFGVGGTKMRVGPERTMLSRIGRLDLLDG